MSLLSPGSSPPRPPPTARRLRGCRPAVAVIPGAGRSVLGVVPCCLVVVVSPDTVVAGADSIGRGAAGAVTVVAGVEPDAVVGSTVASAGATVSKRSIRVSSRFTVVSSCCITAVNAATGPAPAVAGRASSPVREVEEAALESTACSRPDCWAPLDTSGTTKFTGAIGGLSSVFASVSSWSWLARDVPPAESPPKELRTTVFVLAIVLSPSFASLCPCMTTM